MENENEFIIENLPPHLSASTISLFLRCPYALKLKQDAVYQKPPLSSSLIGGLIFHGAIEHLLLTESVNFVKAIEKAKYLFEERNPNDKVTDKIIETVESMVDSYCEILYDIMDENIEGVEYYLEDYFDNQKVVGYVDILTDKRIIDLKTTSAIKQDVPDFSHLFQVSLYNVMYRNQVSDLIISKELHYVTKTEVKICKCKPLDKDYVKQVVKYVSDGMRGVVAPLGKFHSWACKYCTYSDACKYYKMDKSVSFVYRG
jgi:CRISPR/Cas system-associated exonuclease Cas4 (RecB family)